jgi:hypothetical protein
VRGRRRRGEEEGGGEKRNATLMLVNSKIAKFNIFFSLINFLYSLLTTI